MRFLPDSGQKRDASPRSVHDAPVPADALVERIAASTGITRAEAVRVIDDVVGFYAEPMEDLVRRRHAELQLRGHKNPEIFAALRAELADRVVAAPRLTERQLRRIVYG